MNHTTSQRTTDLSDKEEGGIRLLPLGDKRWEVIHPEVTVTEDNDNDSNDEIFPSNGEDIVQGILGANDDIDSLTNPPFGDFLLQWVQYVQSTHILDLYPEDMETVKSALYSSIGVVHGTVVLQLRHTTNVPYEMDFWALYLDDNCVTVLWTKKSAKWNEAIRLLYGIESVIFLKPNGITTRTRTKFWITW